MATGFIYVVTTVNSRYQQRAFCNVPTEWGDRLYFGPCKKPMRPRMNEGDFVFGVSPSGICPRRILFVARIEECISFADAFWRFPELRAPEGPIHVRPINGIGRFPESCYQHIPGPMHANDWQADIASRELDRFFVCSKRNGWQGRWLGACGPAIDDEIVEIFNSCSVYGACGFLGQNTGTLNIPIAYGRLWTGLHLETDRPEDLLAICEARMASEDSQVDLEQVQRPQRRRESPASCSR